MRTFRKERPFEDDRGYDRRRRECLAALREDDLDAPLVPLVRSLNALPFCYTLQCCFGHFVYKGRTDPRNLEPLPEECPAETVQYRLAYLALCAENGECGLGLVEGLKALAAEDPRRVQFGGSDWFWRRHPNSFVLQVEPYRYRRRDRVMLGVAEAREIERVRNGLFARLADLVRAAG
jgi:hypothetical protein